MPTLQQVTNKLTEYLKESVRNLLEAPTKSQKVVAVYAGRFQPFHAGHYSVYKHLVDKFGKDNVYIATSNVTNPTDSPLNFNEKQKFIHHMFDVPQDKIVDTKNPYQPVEILNGEPKNTAFVTAVSSKDADRLGGKYFKKYEPNKKLQPYADKGYLIVAPEMHLNLAGKNISGTRVREIFRSPRIKDATKQTIFKKIYGKFDPSMYKFLTTKLSTQQQPEKKEKVTKNYSDKRITNPETKRKILVKTALSYPEEHPAHKIASKFIGSFREEVRQEADMISRVLFLEGGAAGHMMHVFEDMALSFGDLKRIIELGLQGNLNIEAPVTEKLDGQNIMISYRPDKGTIFARNKGQVKGSGAAALTVDGIKTLFAGRGELSKAFSLAADDLSAGIASLSPKQQEHLFDNGKKFMSVEIIYPATKNVIPYDTNMLVFHNTIEYDSEGTQVGVNKEAARELEGMLRQINANIQNTFKFSGPVVVTLPKSRNFAQEKSKFLSRVNKLQAEFNLSDNEPISSYHKRWWENFIESNANKFKFALTNNVRVGLINRWAFGDTTVSINEMREAMRTVSQQSPTYEFFKWAINFDKSDKTAIAKENIAPFETIFLQLGAEILQNASGLISTAPISNSVKKEIETVAKELERSKNVSKLEKFKQQLKKLQSIGLDKIVPTEGIVFMYKGKVYKLTGSFAPVNQILGLLKY